MQRRAEQEGFALSDYEMTPRFVYESGLGISSKAPGRHAAACVCVLHMLSCTFRLDKRSHKGTHTPMYRWQQSSCLHRKGIWFFRYKCVIGIKRPDVDQKITPPISTINITTTLTGGALLGGTSSPEFVPCATNLHSSSFGHRGPLLPAFLAFWPAHVSASKFNQNGRTGHHPRPPVSVTLVRCCPCAYPFNPYSSPYFSPR